MPSIIIGDKTRVFTFLCLHFIRVYAKNSVRGKKMAKDDLLEGRVDLYEKWSILRWFSPEQQYNDAFNKKLLTIWLKLFMALYDHLTERKLSSSRERDDLFLHFTNACFADFLDNYKWFESKKENRDIGIFEALERIPNEDWFNGWYIDMLAGFSKSY
jgi:hypothetical protein